jgi:Fanconi Anaemia group E protein FANCE.
MSQEEFWIPCIAFMMAFQIFKKRLESKCYIVRKIKDCHSSLKCEFSCYIFSKDKKEEILMDPVVVGVMRLIYWSKILAFGMRRFFWNHQEDKKDNDTVDDHNNSNNDKEDGAGIHKRDDPLRLFFSKELDWIDVFVSWIMEETTTLSCPTHKDDTSCAFVMDCNGHGKEQEKNNLDTNRQEDTSSFQQLWAYFENHSHDDVQGSKDQITSSNGIEDASHQDAKMACCKQRSTEKTYVMNAVALRPELWKMSKNAISQDITEMTEKIITLLNDAGSEDGAMGIEVVATVLATGDTTKQQQKDNADLEQLYVDIFPFSDSLLAGITKKYITEEMSSARIFSFLGSFVLPSIIALARKESRPVTRQLVTMLINLARDRPCEVMGALVIPTMQGTTHLTPTQHDNDTKRKINSKGQSELITRLIKSKCFGTPELSKLASELVRVEWTDQSIAVFMTCLQTKPSLCSATFSTLVERIYICCDKKVLVGSTNYSSFFHTIVTKYSTQVKQEEHVETLLTAANSLTTFLKKTIISALMKMKSV